ncbi:PD-(D/E)XK nuclease family protein [Candidatus Pacearchaeota archaeon]|nr:PD-(D/E)XK nuclease family protein [Candidatus Pacearchaeota archaeon]
MANFKNEFSWSKSRDGVFNECKRKYFFNHYGFWNGWDSNEEDRTKRIYYLKQLNTKEIWLGSIIHEAIKYVLNQLKFGQGISLSYALAILRKKFEKEFIQSSIKKYTGFNRKSHKFFEEEYGIEISEEDKKELLKKAELCLTNFYNSDTFMTIRKTPIEDWIFLENFLNFNFEGDKIFLGIDFAMRDGDKIILYDWKTGKERTADFDLQLTCYALYISERLGVSPKNIIAKIFNLSINKEDTFEINEEKLEEMKRYIQEKIKSMKSFLVDMEENIAKEEKEFPKEEGFYCSRCNFKKICSGEW